jgi:fatty acid desaturase
VNSRTVLYPSFIPANYFMNYVPWQIEHHIFPTVAGFRLSRLSPHLQEYARREGIPLAYETFAEVMPRMLRREWLWGQRDGRQYTYTEAEAILRRQGHRSSAAGHAPPATR